MTHATLESVIGSTAYDSAGEKIGKVKKIYLDNSTGEPTWAAVSTGLFSGDSMVPLAGAQHRPEAETLQVQVDKDHVKSAPYLDDDGHITRESEQELFAHYGVDSRRAGWTAYGRQQIRPGSDEPMTHGYGNDEMIRSEERLQVGTERQEVGTARLRKYVVSEDQTVDVPTTHEEARIEREPITDPAHMRQPEIGEQESEVTLHEDRVTVHKESVPVERVRLEVDEVEDQRTVSDTVRKERIEAEGVETEKNRGRDER
ncbi:PRC and DUF2382 domain-containing protein [Nocardia mexicana]|uniref:Uncharacterized protein (TIGR02271 family) n=1 Tax=Nocardia mexicana TaxID=279262 RepID=A0A370H9L2_9NOCA|nr:PRC and DUF2382 domain-containing protein [Nocardia mexicana]RDI53365.1 uncharacterized protein (TIGR02271 family) [Nocardia mexicana]